MSTLYLLAASLGLTFFIIALILGKQGKKKADYILAVWFLIFFLNFLSLFLLNLPDAGYQTWKLVLFEFSEASIFLHGPLLFFYAHSLITKSTQIRTGQILHAIPFLIGLSILFAGLVRGEEIPGSTRNILLFTKMMSLLVYALVVLKMLHSHSNRVEDIFSNVEKKHLRWLSILTWGVLVVWAVASSSLIVDRFTQVEIPQYGGLFTNVALSLFVFVIGFFGVNQPSIFVESPEGRIKKEQGRKGKVKYEKSGLTIESAQLTHTRILEVMEEQKPFLEPELTLYSLSELLKIPPNHLSQAINSIEGKNFFDFINLYRINEAKKHIQSNEKDHLTLLGIAFEAGFNSKTSFNRAFKKHVGQTPSEYRKKASE